MAETVNTSALLLSDGQGGYSKAFMESMTDIVKLQNGSSLTEKLAEIDGKLPITLTSGTLPETLNSGRILVNGSSFYCGNSTSNLCQLALKNDIPAQYVHPAQKQCNYAYTHPSAPQCDLKNGNFSLVSRYTESGSKTHTSLVTGSRKDPTFDNDIFSSKVDAFKELNMVSICSFFVVDFTLGGTSVDDSTSLFVHLGGYNSYASYTARKGTTRMIYYCGDLRDIACPVKHSNYSGNTGNIVCSYYAQLFSIALITPSFP